ncbi:unnamed protein product [Rotaria socialis]|uniref:Aminopeptidase n=1 Tax=Rotaria socialis TaxID=392032 RepID=A0A818D7R0_9BILA|nr:unnamed protein product [Rotaria socialis]CAF4264290.1 unnamed protein product [Rotaria socialis]
MTNAAVIQFESKDKMLKTTQSKRFKLPILGIVFIFGMLTVALSITILVKINKIFSGNPLGSDEKLMMNSKALRQSANSDLAASIHIDEVMSYLNGLQRIGKAEHGTRAVGTSGFNATLDFIRSYLTANTNYKVTTSVFSVIQTALAREPILMSSINGNVVNHTYSASASSTEFYYVQHTRSANFSDYVDLTVIPNVGCSDADWRKASPPPAGRVVLVKRGDCTFVEKGELASKYKAAALLLYNDGTAPDRMAPLFVTLGENNTLPALFLSFDLGQKLATAATEMRAGNVRAKLNIVRRSDFPILSANICADTPTGDPTQTIVIGSHSDSVTDGVGINDNGSGTAANLALAVTLARLFRSPAYPKYKYRVRFCWWGAEELGLLGSDFHVKQAKTLNTIGDRLSDYLINLNYDMLGSPNYIFGIYDGRTANNATPPEALPGSNKITAVFRDWFIRQNLPWDYTDFSGRSDYGPFLAEGIVAGGLFSGGDDIKTQKQRDRYDEILGQGLGGISGIIQDPCYHKACDSIQNINLFGYEKMVQAAAYALEYLGRQHDLKTWLYPSIEVQHVHARSQKLQQKIVQEYNSMNEHYDIFFSA